MNKKTVCHNGKEITEKEFYELYGKEIEKPPKNPIDILMSALAELAERQEEINTQNQLALAELAETGGV